MAKQGRDADEVLGRKRRHPRAAVNHEFASLQDFIREYVRDISDGGVFIRTQSPLAVGTRVDLSFTILADEIETVEGTGVVVRSVSPGGPHTPGMGVAFERLTRASREVVERLTRAPVDPDRGGGSP